MNARTRRHQCIQGILTGELVASQEELAHLLAEQGIQATQATLSRDLRELGVVKGADGYHLPGEISPRQERVLGNTLESFVVSVAVGGTLVVLKTGPGHAQIVGLELDRNPPDGVIGTIAGDDTIFIATRSKVRARELADALTRGAALNQ